VTASPPTISGTGGPEPGSRGAGRHQAGENRTERDRTWPDGSGQHSGQRTGAVTNRTAGRDRTRLNLTSQNGTSQDRASQNGASQNGASQNGASQNGASQNGASQDRADQGGADLTKIARGSTLNLVGAALSAAATLGVTVLVTREFSRPVAGAFFTATSLFMIIEILASLGSYNGVIYFLARLRTPRQISAMLRVAVVPVIIVSAAAGCALFAFAEPLARDLLGGHLDPGVDPASVARALRILALTVPFASLLDTYTGASRGFHDMRPTVIVDRIGRSSIQLVGVAVAALTGSAALLAPLWVLPYVPAAVLAWLWFRRIASRRMRRMTASLPAEPRTPAGPVAATEPARRRPAGARAGGFWRFTAPRAMAATAQIVIQRLDIVLVGIIRGPVDAAIYTAATRFLVVGQLGNIAISMAAQPQLARLFAHRDLRSANAVYQATTAWLIILTWPLYLLAVVYGPAVLAVFGHAYRAGSLVIVILGLTMLLTTACGQVDIVLTTAGRSSWSLANWLLAVVINVSVDLALIPKHGIIGAAIGWAAALAITNLVMLAEVRAIVRVSPFGRGCLVACVISAVSFGLIPFGARMLVGRGPVVSGLAVLAGCALFAAGLWRSRHMLQLTAMPGLSVLAGPARARGAALFQVRRQSERQGAAGSPPPSGRGGQGKHRRRA
jgi:O-antigen/teichoic acid export membrane protein